MSAVLLVALSVQGCIGGRLGFGNVGGSGRVTEEKRAVRGVSAGELATSGELTIDLGAREALIIEAGDLDADTIEARTGSSGDMTVGNVRAQDHDVRLSSSGNLTLAGGEVAKQTAVISGSGIHRGDDPESSEADVRLSSSGSATIRVIDYLRAHLSSTGELRYSGDPEVDKAESSSGDAERIRD